MSYRQTIREEAAGVLQELQDEGYFRDYDRATIEGELRERLESIADSSNIYHPDIVLTLANTDNLYAAEDVGYPGSDIGGALRTIAVWAYAADLWDAAMSLWDEYDTDTDDEEE